MSLLVQKAQVARPLFGETAGNLAFNGGCSGETAGNLASIFSGAYAVSSSSSGCASSGGSVSCVA